MNDKKYSVGISLLCDEEYYENIFSKYNSKIDYVYFSPNLGTKFQSRLIIQKCFEYGFEKRLINILNIAKKYNIKIELAINSDKKLNKKDVELAYLWCLNNNVMPNSIVTFNELIHYTKLLFGDSVHYICSYNENLRKYEDLYNVSELFDEVVLGNNFIRDTTAFSILKERGFKIRVLLNNGCSHNCLWCSTGGSIHCDTVFENNLKKHSIEELIAIQSVFPYEIKEFYEKTGLVDSYKISNRSVHKEFFDNILKVYFDNNFDLNSVNDIYSTFILFNISTYFKKNFSNIDINKIIYIKNTLIKEELKKIEVE